MLHTLSRLSIVLKSCRIAACACLPCSNFGLKSLNVKKIKINKNNDLAFGHESSTRAINQSTIYTTFVVFCPSNTFQSCLSFLTKTIIYNRSYVTYSCTVKCSSATMFVLHQHRKQHAHKYTRDIELHVLCLQTKLVLCPLHDVQADGV